MTGRDKIGVPYARQEVLSNGTVVQICPVCGLRFEMEGRKDEDSFARSEYATHYVLDHEGAVQS